MSLCGHIEAYRHFPVRRWLLLLLRLVLVLLLLLLLLYIAIIPNPHIYNSSSFGRCFVRYTALGQICVCLTQGSTATFSERTTGPSKPT